MSIFPAETPCPCGNDATYADCCGKYHSGLAQAETAEKLMRSRYCAFVLRNGSYLTTTFAEEKRGGFDSDSIAQDETNWIGLEVIDRVAGGILDQSGQVEFIARFIDNGVHLALHEISNFERRDGKWFYVDGVFPETEPAKVNVQPSSIKAGRNDPCPCGSGKKYKKCCG